MIALYITEYTRFQRVFFNQKISSKWLNPWKVLSKIICVDTSHSWIEIQLSLLPEHAVTICIIFSSSKKYLIIKQVYNFITFSMK